MFLIVSGSQFHLSRWTDLTHIKLPAQFGNDIPSKESQVVLIRDMYKDLVNVREPSTISWMVADGHMAVTYQVQRQSSLLSLQRWHISSCSFILTMITSGKNLKSTSYTTVYGTETWI